jgi:hypothetical protein
MRSRAARLTISAAALIALAAAGFLAYQTERRIATRHEAVRAFDLRARETANILADIRSAQEAYVAAGQGAAYWMPKVTALLEEVAPKIDQLRASAVSTSARSGLMEAAARVSEFGNVDRRVRDYMRSGQTLMASDVVFTEGGETTVAAARLVESARLAEHQTLDADEAALRRRQAAVLAGAAGFGALVLLALAWVAPRARDASMESEPATDAEPVAGGLMLRTSPAQKASARVEDSAPAREPVKAPSAGALRGSAPMLKAASELCTDFSRATNLVDLTRLLARAADVMDASGIVVWLGDGAGGDLRPVLAHGYSEHVLARLSTIPREADNAAAEAYRTGKLQIVLKRPAISNGAVVAPLLASEGCIGAFTAEILAGSETSDAVQALASLFAAQLTGILAASLPAAPRAETSRIASA